MNCFPDPVRPPTDDAAKFVRYLKIVMGTLIGLGVIKLFFGMLG